LNTVKIFKVSHFLYAIGWMKPLIAGRATAKEIDIARSYTAKDSGTDDNIDSYWKVELVSIC
jgi:hypothetical protein